MVQIIPAILSTKEEDYARDILLYKRAASFKEGWVHIDFMDNLFVPNKSIEPSVIAKYPINLHKEAHPMVLNPIEWIDELVNAGFERIVVHIEAKNVLESLEQIKSKGLKAGLAIKKDTMIEKLQSFIGKIDTILVMTIDPGFQGQPFIPQALDKVRNIKSKNWSVRVGVDGAVKDDNIKQIIDTGVDFVIVGSYLLKGDIDENLESIWEKING